MKLKFIDKDEKKKGPIFKKKFYPDKDGDNIKPIGTYKPNKNTGTVKFENAKRESFPIYKSETGNVIKDIKKSLYTSEDVRAIGAGGGTEAEQKKFEENKAGAAALKAREDKMPAAVKNYKEKKETDALLAEAEESFKGTRFEKKKK